MAEILEIKPEQVKKYIPKDEPFTIKLGEGEDILEIEVKPKLSLIESIAFINSVINEMFSDDDETNMPYAAVEYIKRTYTLMYYTNLPDMGDDLYDLVYNTDIFERFIESGINTRAYEDLMTQLDKQIEYEVQKRQNQFKVGTEQFITTVTNKIQTVLDEFAKLGEAFKDIDPKEIQGMIKSLSAVENIDEKKLANAVLQFRKPQAKKKTPKKVEN